MNNDDFLYDENCPCAGCPSEGACVLEKQACKDFLHYVNHGENRHQDRQPSAALYRRLFPTEAGVE
jgi:hypothetical protein